MPMPDHTAEIRPAELRKKADGCRVLAATSNSAERKTLWLARADQWEELALKRVEPLLDSVKSKRIAGSERTIKPL